MAIKKRVKTRPKKVTKAPTAPVRRYTLASLVKSKELFEYKDILFAVLSPEKLYSLEEARNIVNEHLSRKAGN